MPDVTRVHLVRHGEVHNPEKVLYGRLPGYVLSQLGHEMAERVGSALSSRDVVHLLSSPLERAQQTIAPLAQALGITPVLDERVIEAGNAFEGKPFGVGDGVLRRPANWRKLLNPWQPSWGEAYIGIAARMRAAVADARRVAAGHEAVIVSHQSPVWIARRSFEAQHLWHDPRRRQCSLASITTLVFTGDQLTEITFAEPAADLLPGKAGFGA